MFLCSRWGKSLSELEGMPCSEFLLHKKFWQNTRWGMETDILSIVAAQSIATRTESKPMEPWRIKEMSVSKGFGQKLAALVIRPAHLVRQGFNHIIETLKGIA